MASRYVHVLELYTADSMLESDYKGCEEVPEKCYICGGPVGGQGKVPIFHCIDCGRAWAGETFQQAAYLFFKLKHSEWEISPVDEKSTMAETVGGFSFGKSRKKKKPLVCCYCGAENSTMFPGPPFPVCNQCKGGKASVAMKRRASPEKRAVGI